MRNIFIVAITVILGFVISSTESHAAPACVGKAVSASKPLGKASLHKLVFHVYDGEFWTDAKSWDMSEPHALHLTYFVNLDPNDLTEQTIEEVSRDPSVTEDMKEEYNEILPTLYPDVKKGETITALYQPKKGITFCHNGKVKGVMTNLALSKPFMGIWLGQYSSEPELRDKLLGKNSG
jgi:Chalcone isomerase-like